MLGTAAKQVVVIEIEVDDLPISIDRQTSDVVTKIAIPINSKPIGATRHITAIARYRLRQLRRISLLRPERIAPLRPMLVAIPKPNDQFHKEMAIEPMPFASGGISKIRRIFPQIDLYDLIERLVPKLDERLLDVESGGICWSACVNAGDTSAAVMAPAAPIAPAVRTMRLRRLISLSVPMDASNKKSLNDRVMSVGVSRTLMCLSAFNTSL